MEGKIFESAENNSLWRELKHEAPAKAVELISEIEGFDGLTYDAQTDALDTLLDQLTKDNANRFVASEVARERARIEEIERHKTRIAALEVSA